MAKVIKLTNHDRAFIATMKSTEVTGKVRQFVEAIAANAGPGHVAEVKEGRTRTRGTVTAVTAKARKAESENKTLTKAGHAARR